ncbi:30S ribosomal protein S21 [Candidatus Dojkabacteria bacterium]|uniref:Small ribosomal subunit protein bS21 n=1 Tax=Candidatus Dojkabacteria bacterium TaxID=2099670 RepID=A0A955L2K9_9BACT|nr:30S ribosomal protein S21 [Candidatus Dojkabacteria bacterium]
MSKFINKPKDFGLTVYEHNHRSFEIMLKKFKKRMQHARVIEEYKDRQSFTPPSVKNRLKKKAAIYNAKRNNVKD